MGMESKPFGLQSPEFIAKEYGGNKQKIASAAQMGMIDPTSAVLAGMFIDRMRSAQMLEQGPQQTIAQQVLTPQPAPQPSAPPMGGPAPAPMAAPPMGGPAPAPQGPLQMASGGLTTLPVPDHMFDEPAYGGGGIVAFAKGDEVESSDPYHPALSQFPQFSILRSAEDRIRESLEQLDTETLLRLLEEGQYPQKLVREAIANKRGEQPLSAPQEPPIRSPTQGDFPQLQLPGIDFGNTGALTAPQEPPVRSPTQGDFPQLQLPGIDFGNTGALTAPSATSPAVPGAPLNAATEKGLLAAAGPSILNDRLYRNIEAKLAESGATPTQSTAEMYFGKSRADAPAPRKGIAQLVQPAVTPAPETSQPAAGTEEKATSIEDFIAKQRKYQGEDPGAPPLTDVAARKKEDLWSTLAQMGFGIAAGTSPNALVNIGQGAAGAMPAMRDAMKERRAAERENEKLAYEHQLKMWGYRGDEFKAASELHMKDVDRLQKERQLGIQEQDMLLGHKDRQAQIAATAAQDRDPVFRAYWDSLPPEQRTAENALKFNSSKSLFRDVNTNLDKASSIREKYKDELSWLKLQAGQPGPVGENAKRALIKLEAEIAEKERQFQAERDRFAGGDTPAPSGVIPWDKI
jgi:hypothetical protein